MARNETGGSAEVLSSGVLAVSSAVVPAQTLLRDFNTTPSVEITSSSPRGFVPGPNGQVFFFIRARGDRDARSQLCLTLPHDPSRGLQLAQQTADLGRQLARFARFSELFLRLFRVGFVRS